MYATLRDSIINVSAILNISRDKRQFLYDMQIDSRASFECFLDEYEILSVNSENKNYE